MDQAYYRRMAQLEARMDRMEAMMQAVLARLDIDPAEFQPREAPELGAVREALWAGNKIHAIKLYREHYGVGLREAKQAVDAMEAGH